jgi:glutamyl-tRNA synthetase
VDPVLGDLEPEQVRVRFCPSPTGNPHVGVVRTALFNWAFARHFGGTFVFRIEDTDSARDSEESYQAMVEALRWLGLDWDEGPEVGGPHAPYRQSQRLDVYADVAARLQAAGLAYESFSAPDDVEQRRRARGEDPKLGYDNHDRDLTPAQREEYRAAGRRPVLRLRMPDRDWAWTDLVRGDITVAAAHLPDFVITRSNGEPLYTLVNPVDDVLMGITHVLRGEDLLSSTPRQMAMYAALAQIGIGAGTMPRFGHLPFVMGEGNRKLSKRDPESSLQLYRDRGFLPEGLLNYLALLGWSIAEDRDIFSMAEMAQAFDIRRVNPNPARFDLAKCEAITGTWVRRIETSELADRLVVYMDEHGLLPPAGHDGPSPADLVRAATPLVQERVSTLGEAAGMLRFLVMPADRFTVEREAAAALGDRAGEVLAVSRAALADLASWSAADIEAVLRTRLVDGLGIKPRHAFTPVRVAATGRRVSPPLFESLELLGRERTLERLAALSRSEVTS